MEWEPFLLNPNTPEEGEDIAVHLTRKYGPAYGAMAKDPNNQVAIAGRAVGIHFNPERKIVKTIKAHCLMEHVKLTDNEKANRLMEELYKRYFEDAVDINQETALLDLCDKCSIDKEEATQVIRDANLHTQIYEVDKQAKSSGINGVPYFVIERKRGGSPIQFSGALPIDTIAEQLEEASR